MKIFLVSIALAQVLWAHAVNAQILPTQYCPVANDFVLMAGTLTPDGYIGFSFFPPTSFTANYSQTVNEPARLVTLRGQSYVASAPRPYPVSGGLGPLTAGPYSLDVRFTYDTPQGVQPCPTLQIPFVVGGSGAAPATPVPSVSTWMLMALAGLLGGLGLAAQRRVRGRYSGH